MKQNNLPYFIFLLITVYMYYVYNTHIIKTILNNHESHDLTLTEAVNIALEVAGYKWHYTLLMMPSGITVRK